MSMSRFVSVRMERDAIETPDDLTGLRRFEPGERRWYGVTADGRSERISREEAVRVLTATPPPASSPSGR